MTLRERMSHDLSSLDVRLGSEDLLDLARLPLLPGPSAFPAVTILTTSSNFALRDGTLAEQWSSGDLIALSKAADGGSRQDRVYFTPLGRSSVHPIEIASVDDDGTQISFRVKPLDRWRDCVVQFAILPWRQKGRERLSMPQDLSQVARLVGTFGRHLTVTAELEGESIPIAPAWGIQPASLRTELEATRVALARSTATVEGFMFRLSLGPRVGFPGAQSLTNESIVLRFQLPAESLAALREEAGLSSNADAGFSICPNAMPLAQVDLKAWTEGQSYEEFANAADSTPLGVAGVAPYSHGTRSARRLAGVDGGSVVLSLNVDPDGNVLRSYAVARGVSNDTHPAVESQLMIWTSDGATRNGEWYVYSPAEPRQPLEKKSHAFTRGSCVIPAYGGSSCLPRGSEEPELGLRHAFAPQLFAFGDGLVEAGREVLRDLGYEYTEIGPPSIEARILNGARRRTIVLYCENTAGRRIAPRDLRLLGEVLEERVPPGMALLVEESTDASAGR